MLNNKIFLTYKCQPSNAKKEVNYEWGAAAGCAQINRTVGVRVVRGSTLEAKPEAWVSPGARARVTTQQSI